MSIVIIALHIVVCIALILIVLLQTGKGADLGAAFGGSSQTVFGSQGAGGFLSKLTTTMAVVFMLTSLGLTFISSNSGQSTVMEDLEQPEATAPMEVPSASDRPADSAASQEATAAEPAGAVPESPESSPSEEE